MMAPPKQPKAFSEKRVKDHLQHHYDKKTKQDYYIYKEQECTPRDYGFAVKETTYTLRQILYYDPKEEKSGVYYEVISEHSTESRYSRENAPEICNPRIVDDGGDVLYGKPSSEGADDLPDAVSRVLNQAKGIVPDWRLKGTNQPEQKGPRPEPREPQSPYHPWEDPFFGWRMPSGMDRFTQQSRPMDPGDLSGMPDEDDVRAGIRMMRIKAGDRILTHNEFNLGYDKAQEEAAVRGMTRNPRMNTGGVKQRADGSIAKWNPKLPDDL